MDEDEFWAIIQDCEATSRGNLDQKDKLVKAAVARLSSKDALSFYQLFQQMMDRAFTWPLWGAAYVINRGCGDDSFMDFRASLISRGRALFYKSISDPDSLADEDISIENCFHEGFQYAVTDGAKLSLGSRPKRANPAPSSPSGEQWSDETVRGFYPRLAKKVL